MQTVHLNHCGGALTLLGSLMDRYLHPLSTTCVPNIGDTVSVAITAASSLTSASTSCMMPNTKHSGSATTSPGTAPNPPAPMVCNAQMDTALVAVFLQLKKSVRQLIQGTEASTWVQDNASSCALCLAYSLIGSCFSNCKRSATHRPLTIAETSHLTNWITQRADSME